MSFKWKTILGIAAIELLFLSVLVWQSATYIQNLGETEIEKRARDTVSLASSVLLDALISYDVASAQEQVKQISNLDGVEYVVLEGFGKTLSSTHEEPSSIASPDAGIDGVTDGVFDVHHPFQIEGQALGALKMGFSVKELYSLTSSATSWLYTIAVMELVLVALCSFLLARYLTGRLELLRLASEGLVSGQAITPISVAVGSKDEIGETIRAFNRMMLTLQKRERALQSSHAQLKASNVALKEQEHEMLALFHAAPDGIAVLQEDGCVSFANDELTTLLAAEEAEILGRPLSDFLTFDDPSVDFGKGGEVAGDPKRNLGVVNRSGRHMSIEVKRSKLFTMGEHRTILIIRDRTHEEHLEQEMRVQERLKTSLVDSSLDALVTITGEGNVLDFSQSAEALFGWKKSEVLGQPMAEFIVPPEFRAAHSKGMARFIATGEGPLIGKRVEATACRRDGSTFPIELALTAIWLGEEVFITASIRDITERKEHEAELLRAKAEAEDASKAKSRFLSYMSHEIRSPMHAVLGSLALLREKGNLNESEQYYLDLARDSGNSLLKVVNEVLDFSRIEAGRVQYKLKPCALSELIQSVQALILAKGGVKRRVEMLSQIDQRIPDMVEVDADHLRQILTILTDNAYKFTNEGSVKIHVGCVDDTEEDSGERLRISVQDTGHGIPEDQVDLVFGEYEQTDTGKDTRFGGTGLGLAIAKGLVAGMGGEISVESEEGVGSTFTVEVPFKKVAEGHDFGSDDHLTESGDRVESGVSNDEEKPSMNDSVETVLLVDDVEANLFIGEQLLKSRGYEVDVALDGFEALKRVEEKQYAVILMDMRMPKMDGVETTEKIRSGSSVNAGTPIIALSANVVQSDINRCLDVGMSEFVSKPYDIDRLDRTIKRCLAESRQEKGAMQTSAKTADDGREVLSEEVLGQLAKDTSAESLPLMISVFINEIKKRLEGIDCASKSGDEAEIREQAHALKSCSGTFGGLKLQAVALSLEDLASRSEALENQQVIAEIREVAAETLTAYSNYRNRLGVSSETSH